jgi:hypothetical protein
MEQHTLKNVGSYLNTKFHFYIEAFGGQNSNLLEMFFFVKAGSGLRPRTKRVKNDCVLSADYYNINW